MSAAAPRLDASSPLIDVLRNPAAAELLSSLAPSVVRSTVLHTLHAQPVGLVVATEPDVTAEHAASLIAALADVPPYVMPDRRRSPVVAPADYPHDASLPPGSAETSYPADTPVWRRWELVLRGPDGGNPFVDVELTADFTGPDGRSASVLGFYDGGARYVVRFLPPTAGRWRFVVHSNATTLDGVAGEFEATAAGEHGPVRVDGMHFARADGTRYLPLGTTCYAWVHQPQELQEQTLASLADSPFTKLRMCVFPKSYTFNADEPERYPFPRTDDGWDAERFDPDFWAALERRIDQLDALGIEADVILFHAYDRWGFSTMSPEQDDRYVRYAVARLSAFRNVWWSLANEWDLMLTKTEADWEQWADMLRTWDAAQHPRSIHNCVESYDHSRPWITHVSMQRVDVYRTAENTTQWRREWGKPVIVDECGYEGDIDQGWGNITGEEMTRRFWEGAVRGGYVGHGETYLHPDDILWWAKGGELHGTSPARIAFLRRVIEEAPGGMLEPVERDWDVITAGVEGVYHLSYFGFNRPRFRRFIHDPAHRWHVDVIDTWNMTITTLPETHAGRFTVPLPGRQYMAVRLRRA